MKKLIMFSEMVNEMIVSPLPEALRIAVAKGAKITGSSRCCIILPVKRNKLILHTGYPEEGHGIGQEITGEHAEFLISIMHKHQCIMHIRDPARDPQTPHLKEHAAHHGISSILFAPLLSKEEPLGIMVFDFTSIDVESAETARTAKIVSDFVAHAIAHTHGNAREEENVLQKKIMALIGHRNEQVADVLRNLLTSSGGRARRLKDDDSIGGTSRKHASVIFEDILELERITKNVLDYAQFDPKYLTFKKHDLGKFLRDFLEKERSSHPSIHLHPLRLNHDVRIALDKEMLEAGILDIVRNAAEAGAKNIWMKMKIQARRKRVLISIASDRKAIDKKDLEEIFDPFFSTKTSGAGLSLSRAEAIVHGHGGMITAECKTKKRCTKGCPERTIFKIYLPL